MRHPFPVLPLPFLLLATLARAQEPATADDGHTARPERPTVATHAFAVARGYLELESGVARIRQPDERDVSAILTSKLGVARRLQLTLTTSVTSGSPGVTALDPVFAGLKWQLTPERDGRPTVSVLPGLVFPNGPRRGTTAALSLMAIVSHEFGPVSMDLNLGDMRLNGAGGPIPYMWAASFGGALRGPIAWGLELSGLGDDSGTQPSQLLGYLALTVRPWLVLDAGWSSPPHGAGAHTLFAGATYNVGRMLRRP